MNEEYVAVWDKCLNVIKDNVPGSSFKTWFEPIVPVKLTDKVLTIQVPSAFSVAIWAQIVCSGSS